MRIEDVWMQHIFCTVLICENSHEIPTMSNCNNALQRWICVPSQSCTLPCDVETQHSTAAHTCDAITSLMSLRLTICQVYVSVVCVPPFLCLNTKKIQHSYIQSKLLSQTHTHTYTLANVQARLAGFVMIEFLITPTIPQVKNVWLSTSQAWDGIDTVLPTEGGAWDDQNDPSGDAHIARCLNILISSARPSSTVQYSIRWRFPSTNHISQ
jgi:hypothetical protein